MKKSDLHWWGGIAADTGFYDDNRHHGGGARILGHDTGRIHLAMGSSRSF
jgi:hypothetical protein